MRKAFALFLALAIITSFSSVFAVKAISYPKDKVVFTESRLNGDIKEADGLSIRRLCFQGNWIVWDSNVIFQNGGFTSSTENCFLFSRNIYYNPKYYINNQSKGSVDIYDSVFGGFETTGDFVSDAVYGIDKAYSDLYREAPSGQRTEKTINLNDYFDYIPLAVHVRVDGYSAVADYYEAMLNYDKRSESYIAKKIMDYLKIPMIDTMYTIGIEKDRNGNVISSWGSTADVDDYFTFYTQSSAGDDAIYFFFKNKSALGKTVDTSLIPGGYGIYVLPYGYVEKDKYFEYTNYKGTEIFVDKMKTLYSADEKTEFLDILLSKDEKSLFVTTQEENIVYLNVIDAEKGMLLQKISLYETLDNSYASLKYVDDALLILAEKSLYLFEENKGGNWEICIQSDIVDVLNSMDLYYESFSYDGRRLAVVTDQNWDDSWTGCGFCVAVFDKAGLKYLGRFESSLNDANKDINGGTYPFIRKSHIENDAIPNAIRFVAE